MSQIGDDIRAEIGWRILLTPLEVSEKLDVAESTLANWRCNGGGPMYVKLGGKVGYLPDDIAAFVTAGRKSGGANNNKAA